MPTPAPPTEEPLRLPSAPPPPTRPPLPILGLLAPVAGALVLWAVTGSSYVLWFAALSPVLVVAALVDGASAARRARRRARRENARQVARVRAEIERRHDRERRDLWARHPDVAGFAARPGEIWRRVPDRTGRLVVGRGAAASGVEIEGGDEDAAEVRRRARMLADAPVTIPADAGLAVVGPHRTAVAVVRALALQLALCEPPGRLRIVADDELCPPGLPHAGTGAARVAQIANGARADGSWADLAVLLVAPDAPIPPRCAAVLTLADAGTGVLDHDGASRDVRVEALSAQQAATLAATLATRAAALGAWTRRAPGLAALLADPEAPAPGLGASGHGLACAWSTSAGEPATVDLVADGPHALVIGMTGSGKSELLTSWIVALSAIRTAAQVSFLLVDFKGGRTFDALLDLPHVTGVLTDLDDAGAVRAIQSLRAEIRHRERILAGLGARDVTEAGDALGRLVIVVDEYAALVAAHPGLHDLFADVAARGRALGMHLILASQRATGVFRDALAANAPLRVALRVADAGDSRALLGDDAAARLSADADALGVALLVRAADPAPARVRVARTDPATLARVIAAATGPRARRPWLPTLPAHLPLSELRRPGRIVLGRADEPERQVQPSVELGEGDAGLFVVGRSGSGRSTLLGVIADQSADALRIGADAETAWDRLAALDAVPAGTVVLVDDADIVLDRLGGEYGALAADLLARAAREARSRGIRLIVAAQRISGPLARVADLLPQRAILALPTRADHVAAGGEAADHLPDLPPGRGRLGRRLVQFARVDVPATPVTPPPCPWTPGPRPAAFVTAGGAAGRGALRAWRRAGIRTVPLAETDTLPPAGAVVHGPPDAWLARWQLLAAARTAGDLLIDVACAGEYRTLTARRDLPPFAVAGRAWLLRPDRDDVRRILLPGP